MRGHLQRSCLATDAKLGWNCSWEAACWLFSLLHLAPFMVLLSENAVVLQNQGKRSHMKTEHNMQDSLGNGQLQDGVVIQCTYSGCNTNALAYSIISPPPIYFWLFEMLHWAETSNCIVFHHSLMDITLGSRMKEATFFIWVLGRKKVKPPWNVQKKNFMSVGALEMMQDNSSLSVEFRYLMALLDGTSDLHICTCEI